MKYSVGMLVEVYSFKNKTYLPGKFMIANKVKHKDALELFQKTSYTLYDIENNTYFDEVNIWEHSNGLTYKFEPCEHTFRTKALSLYYRIKRKIG